MTIANYIRRTIARAIGYRVKGDGYEVTHHTLTLAAALEWAACYPAATITRFGSFIARKTIKG